MGFYIAEETLKEIQERLNDPHEICGNEERTKQMIIQKNVFNGNSSVKFHRKKDWFILNNLICACGRGRLVTCGGWSI